MAEYQVAQAVEAALKTIDDDLEFTIAVEMGQDPEPLVYPYIVVRAFDTPDFAMSGPVSDRQADNKLRISVVVVSQHPDQAGLLMDRVRALLKNRSNITPPPGWVVMGTSAFVKGRLVTDDEIRPSTFSISDIWIVQTTPRRGE